MNFYKRSLQYLLPFKWNIAIVLILNICYAIFSIVSLSMLLPFLTIIFDQSIVAAKPPQFALNSLALQHVVAYYLGVFIAKSGHLNVLILVAGSMIIFSFLSNITRYLAFFFIAPVRAGLLKNIRKDLFCNMIILPLSFFGEHKRGDLINRFGSDVQEVEWSIISSVQVACRDPFMLMIFISALLFLNLKLTILTLLVLPVAGFLIAQAGKYIKRYSIRAQKTLSNIGSLFEETISGIKIIKAFNAVKYNENKFDKFNKYHAKTNTKLFRINALSQPLSEFISILSLCVIIVTGFTIAFDNDSLLNGSMFALYFLLFARMLPPAKQIVAAYYNAKKGSASANRIFSIIDYNIDIVDDENAVTLNNFQNKIEFKDVIFTYHKDNIKKSEINGINLTVNKGEIVALTGYSGGGKSTLIDLLMRFYEVDKGEILIDNINIKNYKLNDLHSIIGLVNQDVILFNDTIYNNIVFGLKDVTYEQVVDAANKAFAHDFILNTENGYSTIIGDRGMKLSGGERQRIAIARTLLRKPQIFILDEATSSLDSQSEQIFQKAINRLIKDKTAIIIAHNLATIKKANKIAFIENGNIVEFGSKDELLALKGKFYRFYMLQS